MKSLNQSILHLYKANNESLCDVNFEFNLANFTFASKTQQCLFYTKIIQISNKNVSSTRCLK